jgi:predicted SnoaL-like aldol condensation-catalyzing enzyme
MENRNKQLAVEFLKFVIAGKIDEAYEKYVDMSGRHHNAYFPGDFEALKKGMKENHNQFPDKRFAIKNVLGDGDMVATHSHLAFKSGEPGMIVVHLFRFKNEKIAEMWDCGQLIPKESPNKNGMF